jgi:hypothetical protein
MPMGVSLMRRLTWLVLSGFLAALIPAAAAGAAPGWQLRVDRVSLVPGGETKFFRASAQTPPADPAPDFTVVFDVAAANRIAVIDAPDVCTTTATAITCPDSGSEFYDTPFEASARPDAAVGATASVPVRVVSGGRTVASAAGRITIAEGVDLAAVDLQGDASVATGATVGIAAGVRNAGDRPVTGIVLRLSTVRGFAVGPYRNCAALEFGAACHFDDTLAPGAELRLATPLALRATDAVWAPSRWPGSIAWVTAQDYADGGGTLPIRGTGPELTLAPAARAASLAQTDTVPNNDFDTWDIAVTGSNRSNITARGAGVRGAVGSTVTARVGVRSSGPARLEGYGAQQGSYLTVTVTPPPGTTVVGVPRFCEQFNMDSPLPPPWPPGAGFGDGNYYCFTDNATFALQPRQTVTWDFRLRIDRAGAHRGEIKTLVVGPEGAPPGDPKPTDDRAPIVITGRG